MLAQEAKNSTPPKRGVSIKVKLLLLLILLPTIALSLYFSLAVRLFESDKIAYIFDSSAAVSKTLASQTSAELQSLASLVKPLLENYPRSEKDFKQVAGDIFVKNKGITWMTGFTRSEDGEMKAETSVSSDGTTDLVHPKELIDNLVTAACDTGFALKPVAVPETQNINIYFAVCNAADQSASPHAIVALTQNQDVFNGFKRHTIYSSYLVSKNGNQILGPSGKSIEDFSYWAFFSSIQGRNNPSGTMDTTSPDGRRLLASY